MYGRNVPPALKCIKIIAGILSAFLELKKKEIKQRQIEQKKVGIYEKAR